MIEISKNIDIEETVLFLISCGLKRNPRGSVPLAAVLQWHDELVDLRTDPVALRQALEARKFEFCDIGGAPHIRADFPPAKAPAESGPPLYAVSGRDAVLLLEKEGGLRKRARRKGDQPERDPPLWQLNAWLMETRDLDADDAELRAALEAKGYRTVPCAEPLHEDDVIVKGWFDGIGDVPDYGADSDDNNTDESANETVVVAETGLRGLAVVAGPGKRPDPARDVSHFWNFIVPGFVEDLKKIDPAAHPDPSHRLNPDKTWQVLNLGDIFNTIRQHRDGHPDAGKDEMEIIGSPYSFHYFIKAFQRLGYSLQHMHYGDAVAVFGIHRDYDPSIEEAAVPDSDMRKYMRGAVDIAERTDRKPRRRRKKGDSA